MDGKVSGGGPTDPGERAALLQSGWQPYSFKHGDQWISYQRFDPLSLLFGAAADFAEVGRYATAKEADQFAIALSQGVIKNLLNKTWLSGLSDAFEVLSDPERYGDAYFRKLAGSMAVPALVAQTAQATDPNMRDARTVVDAIKARVPVLSQGLPVRRDVWGDPIKRGDAIGPDLISPVYATQIKRDPLSREVARIRVPLSMPKRNLIVGSKIINLKPAEYDELVQLSGQPARKFLSDFIKTPEYEAMSDIDRVEFMKDTMSDYRKSGRDALKARHAAMGGGVAPGDVKVAPTGFEPERGKKAKPRYMGRPAPAGFNALR